MKYIKSALKSLFVFELFDINFLSYIFCQILLLLCTFVQDCKVVEKIPERLFLQFFTLFVTFWTMSAIEGCLLSTDFR